MAHLIDKDALVAEIKKIYNEDYKFLPSDIAENVQDFKDDVLRNIDTLEVKEVDLDESARNYLLHEHVSPLNEVLHQADLKVEMQYHKDIEDAYKAGFELGLKAKGE